MNKQYELRPAQILVGEQVVEVDFGCIDTDGGKIVAFTDIEVCVEYPVSGLVVYNRASGMLFQEPLFWLDSMPIYLNDVVYYKDDGGACEVMEIRTNGKVVVRLDGCGICSEDIDTLTTKKPLKTKEGWTNIYRKGNLSIASGQVYDTEEEAKNNVFTDCIGTAKVEWQE